MKNKILSIIIIMFVLPYVVIIFANGKNIKDNTLEFGDNKDVFNNVEVFVNERKLSVSWQEFLVGVVAREIPVEYEYEAIKAQMLIVRTRLMKETEKEGFDGFHDAFYVGKEIEEKWKSCNSKHMFTMLNRAAQETQKQVLIWNNQMIETPFHYLNTGSTRNGISVLGDDQYGYLQSVSCPMDVKSERQVTTRSYTYEELTGVLKEIKGIDFQELKFEQIIILYSDENGYVFQVQIQDHVFSGEEFRSILQLASSAFTFQDKNEKIQGTVNGVGHGLGLSQNTAHFMALEGRTYLNILQYFYCGVEVVEK